MIVLFDTGLAYLAMIASFWFSSHTFQTYFLCIVYVFGYVAFGFSFHPLKQRKIEYEHEADHDAL